MNEPDLEASVNAFLARKPRMLINNQWVEPEDGNTIASINPATEETIAVIPEAGVSDINRAVSAARAAFEDGDWSKLTPDARGTLLWRLADLIEANTAQLAWLETLDNGATRQSTAWITHAAASSFRFYAGYANKLYGQSTELASPMGEFHAYTRLEPVGVVASITPWNGPLASVCGKIAPALAAGCSVVVKPSELTSLTTLRLGELILEAGFPEGAVNIVPGSGAVAGQALADHPGIDKVHFTGSTATGRKLIQASAGNFKRLTLELGGKSPLIIFADCDLERAIPLAARAIFANTGQACIAGSRLFVEKPIYEKVVAGISDIADKLRLGNGLESNTDLGPVISETQRRRIAGYIKSGIEAGAELVAGGKVPSGKGYFIQPTVFAHTRPEMKMIQEEIFGPVVAVEPFTDIDDVIRRANATSYGLASGIVTGNVGRAHNLARRIRAGNVWINCYGVVGTHLPFGGFKQSGWGRQFGWDGIEACTEKKTIHVAMA